MIRARQLEKKAGLNRGVDVKTLCEYAGVSRKTGYEWVKKTIGGSREKEKEARLNYDRLKTEHEKLTSDFEQVRFENEGRKIAWEIHKEYNRQRITLFKQAVTPISIDEDIWRLFGDTKAIMRKRGKSIMDIDLLIACTAKIHAQILVTNDADFDVLPEDFRKENWV